MNSNETIFPGWNRNWSLGFVAMGLVALAAVFVLGGGSPASFFQAYLFAFVFWISVSLGGLGLSLLHHIVRGSWGIAVLRIFEAASRTLPLMLLLFLPIAFGLHYIYPWAQPERVAASAVLRHRTLYLNEVGVLIRAAVYFLIWIGLAVYLNRSSLAQDRTGDARLAQKRTNVASPGLVLFILSVTFAFTDWVMSLDAEWYSTIYGLWFVVAQALTMMAGATLLVMAWSDRRPYSEVVTPGLTRDLGNLLLMMTLVWTYLSLSQFLIIYAANLPEEVTYYVNRQRPGWGAVGVLLILGQFLLPFLLLLSGRTKRTPGLLLLVAGIILFMRFLDFSWVVIPAFPEAGVGAAAGLLLLAGMGAIWLAVFIYQLKRNPLLPRHEPRMREVLEHA